MGCCPPSSTFGFEHIFSRNVVYQLAAVVKWLYKTRNFVTEKKLANIYLDASQPASFGGLDSVYRAVKQKGKNKISPKQVRDWLSQQDVYTLHKPARRRYKRSRVIVPGIDAQSQADLVDLQNLSRYNKGYKYLLTCVDIFNKYSWVLPLKSKQGQELVKAFQKILSTGRKPSKL